MRHQFPTLLKVLLFALSAIGGASCSVIFDDNDGCPAGLYVRFVYDYNTLRADIFKDHVGHVQLYVFDEEGSLAAFRSVSNTPSSSPLSRYGFTIHFSPEELPSGHRYTLRAIAMQRDWDEAAAAPGARFRLATSTIEDSRSLKIDLDHDSSLLPGTNQFPVDASTPLDTLWHTLKVITHAPKDGIDVPDIDRTSAPFALYPDKNQMVEVKEGCATYATVSLIRDTKHLTLTLRQVDTPEAISASDYDVFILDNNASLAHDNSVVTGDSIRYSPYASWTSRILDDNSLEIETVHTGNPGQYVAAVDINPGSNKNVLQRTAHYNLMFNRLMLNPDRNHDNAMLEIRNRQTQRLIARVNLPYILSQGRHAYEIRNYAPQEYLDREYDYHLDFFLKGDDWMQIELHVLSWSKRIDNVELK